MNEELSIAVRNEVDSYLGETNGEDSITIDDVKNVLAGAAVICVVAYGVKKAWNAAVRRQARKNQKRWEK